MHDIEFQKEVIVNNNGIKLGVKLEEQDSDSDEFLMIIYNSLYDALYKNIRLPSYNQLLGCNSVCHPHIFPISYYLIFT